MFIPFDQFEVKAFNPGPRNLHPPLALRQALTSLQKSQGGIASPGTVHYKARRPTPKLKGTAMSSDGLVLAYISDSSQHESGTSEYWLLHLLEKLFREKIFATGCRFAPIAESERAWKSVEALGEQSETRNDCEEGESLERAEKEAEGIAHILSFIPAHALIHGSLRWHEHELSASFKLIAETQELIVKKKAPEDSFLSFLDSIIGELLRPLLPDQSQIREKFEALKPTRLFPALRSLSQAYHCWFYQQNIEEAKDAANKARTKDPNFYDPLRFLAQMFREAGQMDQELATINEEAQLYEQSVQPFKYGETLMRLGQSLIHYKRYDDALDIYDQCQKHWKSLTELRLEVQVRSNRANLYLRKGLKEEAIAEYQAGLNLLSETEEDHAQLLYNLGLAQSQLRRYEPALETLEKALSKARSRHNSNLICRIYNARGAIYDEYEDQKNLEKALQQYRLAEEYFSTDDDPTLLAGLKDHMAITYRKLGRLDDALRYSEQACQLLSESEHEEHRAIAFLNRASLLIELGDYPEARNFAQDAAELFMKLQSPHLESVQLLLSRLEDALGPEDYGPC
jgi:tetratricopeptide (TPR) repeat protein